MSISRVKEPLTSKGKHDKNWQCKLPLPSNLRVLDVEGQPNRVKVVNHLKTAVGMDTDPVGSQDYVLVLILMSVQRVA